jgi:uncharacterized repeat protein (TIGR01451 family)/fimbrial isopeptide formation D2 family protein
MLLKKPKSKLWAAWISAAFGVLALLLAAEVASAAPCDIKPATPAIIRHDLGASYCELCGTGYVTIVIANPYEGADMINMTVEEDLRSSGLTFDSTASPSIWINGVSRPSAAPIAGPPNNSILTWTSAQIAELGSLAFDPDPGDATTLTIRFAVTRYSGLSQEGLHTATRDMAAEVIYTAQYLDDPPPPGDPIVVQCLGMPATVNTGVNPLQYREPDPVVAKGGRNVDAAQGSYTPTVYGNDNDDVIWRIRVTNNGNADLQGLRLDDVMETDNIDISYICPSEAAAEEIAITNNGAGPSTMGCVSVAGNSVLDYDVDNPFGNPGGDPSDIVDVLQSGNADIFLVGKIPVSVSATGIGACSLPRTNTVNDVEWGCEGDPPPFPPASPAGGIDSTSTGSPLTDVTATLSTLSDTNLDISVDYDGVGPGNPDPGMKGRVIITITNNSGGTVSDLVLTNALPDEYVVDATFAPTLAATGAYGYYAGLTNQINWDNPAGNPLLNTDPQFTLTSNTTTNDGHANLLRNGDTLVITFGVVLVHQPFYDLLADLDVIQESPGSSTDPDTTLPAHNPPVFDQRNILNVAFENFCTPGTTTDTVTTFPVPAPEDLDIETYGPSGPVLDYIITNNNNTTLTVRLTNNGGHGAADYYVYVAFGRTMDVDLPSLPSGCTATPTDMPPLNEWQDPLDFPSGATIIECKENTPSGPSLPDIARNGGYLDLDFIVSKSSDPADIAADDLTFRADVIGEITLFDGTRLDFPSIVARGDGITDRANNYSIDAIRARVMGFNLTKDQAGNCSENNPPPGAPDDEVQIGEECSYNVQAGGWFGFLTPGYTPIEVRNVRVDDVLPNGQGYVDRSAYNNTGQIDVNPDFQRVVAPTPPTQYDMAEGTLFWTFNETSPYITQRDEWFEVDVRTRLLNDPIDASGVPNQHADTSTNNLTSNFNVVFLAGTGNEFTVPYGPSMSVYPPLADRQVSLTVTEPEITVVKEVCNESLSGTGSGPGCSPWVTTANNGDALNDYIYRLTVTNEASSGGVARAPAYDVTVTDTLDASDLAYVQPFGSDGLNNDGDTTTDGADAGGEGAISNNVVNSGGPAVLTFSYTHSDSLLRIDPGNSVQLYYRVDFDDDAAPLQTFTNTAVATYDSLEGQYGNQSDNTRTPPSSYGPIGDARYYTSPTASADVQIIPIETQPKRIAALSNTPIAGSGTQGISIGEEVEYRLNTLLPVALLRNFVIRDELPAGITCEEAPNVDLGPTGPYAAAGFSPGGNIVPTCNDTEVQWVFGDQRVTAGTAGLGNRYDFGIGFIARVANTAGNNDGDTITNGNPSTNAFARYVDEVGATITQNFNEVDIEVHEPLINLTKAFAVANADAADVLTITVTATNNGTATAYNLRVLDDLTGTNLTYIGNVGGINPPDTIDTTTFGANQPIFSWSAPNGIDPTDTVSFTFEVGVANGVQPQEILDNTIQADWTSLPGQTTALNTNPGQIGIDGAIDGMRNGALPNANDPINDYETTATDNVLVPEVVLTKTDLNPAVIPTIGVHKSFQIDITLPEGTTNNLTVTDTLNSTGLSYVLENEAAFDITYTFQGIATINGAAPGEAALTAFPADETSNSAVWNIGTVVTQTENDTSTNTINPLIRINYFARINNDAVTDAGDTLQNSVAVQYTHGETAATVTLTGTTAIQTVVEPSLGLAKTVANITSGGPPQAGDILRYTLTVTAAGGGAGDNFSDAFDLRIDDSLSLGLIYNGNPTVSGAGNTISAPLVTGDGVTTPQILLWSLEDANADIDIIEGTVVTITYDVLVDNGVLIGQSLSNSVSVQWTSLDGPSVYERNGTGAPWLPAPGAAYNDYYIGPISATVVVGDNTATAKTRLLDTYGAGDNVVRIGDILEYELRLSLQEGTYNNVSVTDALPLGLMFEEIASINGDTAAPYTAVIPFAHADIPAANIVVAGDATTIPNTVTMTLGDIVNQADGNAANDVFIIIYRARVLNLVHPQVNNIALTNTAAMGYDTISGPATTVTDTETIDVRQPNLTVVKTAVAAGGDAVLDANELVTYTIDIANTGTAPAYDTVLRDIIPVGMRNGAATITMVSIQLLSGGPALPNLAPLYDAATGIATWDFDSGTANQYNIPAGDTLRVVYQTQTDAGLAPGMTLTNQAQVQLYYSFDDDAVPTLGAAIGVREIYGPSNVASVTFTTAGAAAMDKSITFTEAAIGEPFTYRITVPATPQTTALHDVRILDDLSASAAALTFISVAKAVGSEPWTPINTGSATNLVIEDTTVGIDIPAGEQIVIDITVRLVDTQPAVDPPPAPNNTGALFGNTANYTYNQINGDGATQQPGGSDISPDIEIVGPDMLVMDKSGPASMSVGIPAGFVLDIENTWSGAAWNLTIVDRLPDDPVNGGTCGAGPSNITAQFFDNGGTPTSGVLVAGTDYTVSFDASTCEWTLQLLSAAGPLRPTEHLIINYEIELDPDTQNAVSLTNVAGVTQWYGYDPNAANAAPHQYTYALTDGTPGDPNDQEDAHTINTLAPDLDFFKHVRNVTTGQDPGLNASPGDTLHYTLEIINNGLGELTNFSIVDEVDALNSPPLFVAGSLVLTNVPAGAVTTGTNPLGGANGTGLINVTNLNIGAAGSGTEQLVVEFEVTLVPVIASGTVVLNQAGLLSIIPATILSDDPNVAGGTDPTETLIASEPLFQVQKISTDMTGDPAVLMAGETLRYTLTIKNIGSEDAVNVRLRDYTPANTTYVANSTTLNGTAVPDPSPGVNPLIAGILINAPENLTPGYMRADAAPGANNVATVIFDVVVDPSAMNGLIIENQGFVSGEGSGSGPQPDQPSDDPDTPVPDDPTRDVVGNVPLLYAHKTVVLFQDDFGAPGIVDPGDVLRYTIDISNIGAIPATGVVLTDDVPANTSYEEDSLRLNGVFLGPDGGVSPLIAGLTVESSDNPGPGIVSAGQSAVITFDVRVNLGVPAGTIISNQGDLTSNELPPGLTDADGLPANGYQPTIIVVGNAQFLTISKSVAVVGGGPALAGGQLEYIILVTNVASVPANNVVVTDDLGPPLDTQVTYIPGSGTLNGASAGVTFAGLVLTADYAATYGDLPPGNTAEVRFRVQINPAITIGTTITNTGVVSWNSPTQTDSASVSIDVGGTPGSAALNGNVWHDASLDQVYDSTEQRLEGWSVALYLNNVLVATVTTDINGVYQLSGLLPNEGTPDLFELRFTARGAGPSSAALGYTDSIFTDGPHRISNIVVASGDNLQNLNLPIQPNGTVYDSVVRVPINGSTLTMRNAATGAPVSSLCFDDPNQQNQVTAEEGFYKFDINFSDGSCPAGAAYLIDVTPPSSGYLATPSLIIPPASDATTPPFSVPACPGSPNDAVPATPGFCEIVVNPAVPPVSVPPRTAGTIYHLHLLLSDGSVPGESQIFNNPIPIDPEMEGATAITKTTAKLNITRGSLVPYTITVNNVFGVPLYDLSIIDRFPAGFKYVADSARMNGTPAEPQINGLEMVWDGLTLQATERITIQFLLVVGSGVSEGEYTNRALVFDNVIGANISGEATATVRVIPDPDFDCTDVIGKVFDDRNLDGQQDTGEIGIAGVRVVTARGLIATTDEHGRFHITCATVPDEDRGSNFILKLDERSLPTGYRLTTENPRVQRATRGKMIRFNFGTTIHRVVRIDIADGVFEPNTSKLRLQWTSKIVQLIEELKKAPSVLRLSYLADVERKGLVNKRLEVLKNLITNQWKQSDGGYPLTVETEVFWRRGAPFVGQ